VVTFWGFGLNLILFYFDFAGMLSRVARSVARSSVSVARPSLPRVWGARAMSGAAHHDHGHGHGDSGPPSSRIKSSEDLFPEGPSWAEVDKRELMSHEKSMNERLLG
jgi:hypothetical protein